MKKIYRIIIALTLMLLMIPASLSVKATTQVFESYTATPDSDYPLTINDSFGETFTPSINHTLSSVNVTGLRHGAGANSLTVTIYVYATNPSTHFPQTLIETSTFSSNLFGVDSRTNVAANFSNSNLLVAGTEYVIFGGASGGTYGGDHVMLSYKASGGYGGGIAIEYGYPASQWYDKSPADMIFSETGNVAASNEIYTGGYIVNSAFGSISLRGTIITLLSGNATTWGFQTGNTTSYGANVTATGSMGTLQLIALDTTGHSAGETIHYRAEMYNAAMGWVYGSDAQFTYGYVTTNPISTLSENTTSATSANFTYSLQNSNNSTILARGIKWDTVTHVVDKAYYSQTLQSGNWSDGNYWDSVNSLQTGTTYYWLLM